MTGYIHRYNIYLKICLELLTEEKIMSDVPFNTVYGLNSDASNSTDTAYISQLSKYFGTPDPHPAAQEEKPPLKIYRKRLIPAECLLLKGDVIEHADEETIVTSWTTINPKKEFSHGCSCYFLKLGFKVSKFYRHDNTLLYWYCDIVDFEPGEEENSLIVTDLLADVILYPDGQVHVVDLDELADALDKGLITQERMSLCLRRLNDLLSYIYRDKFDRLQSPLEQLFL